jgi:hypothetical protein
MFFNAVKVFAADFSSRAGRDGLSSSSPATRCGRTVSGANTRAGAMPVSNSIRVSFGAVGDGGVVLVRLHTLQRAEGFLNVACDDEGLVVRADQAGAATDRGPDRLGSSR